MNRLLLLAPRIATNRLWARAGEVPSFHIAPARTGNAKDLITDSLLGTYNSASPAWAVGPDGVLFQPAANAPVIEYDPTTLACLGERIWGVVTNLATWSEDFRNTATAGSSRPWAYSTVSVTSDTGTAPNGASTADTVQGASGTANKFLSANFSTTTVGAYVFSVFLKQGTEQFVEVRLTDGAGNGVRARVNLSVGTFVITNEGSATAQSASVTAFPNGWYRCSVTCTVSSVPFSIMQPQLWLNSFGINSPTTSFYAWGAQLQTGSTVGPYVPTSSTTASSTADVWDVLSLTAGINNLKTIYFRGRTAVSGTRGIASLNDNSSSNRLELSISSSTSRGVAITGGATVANLIGGTIAANTTFRMAARFDTDSYAMSFNGGAFATDASGARALVDRLFIGRDQAGNYQNGYIEEMAVWTKACTDAQLVALAAS